MNSGMKCTNCGATLDKAGQKSRYKCPYCGTINTLEPDSIRKDALLCPQCGEENALDAEHCASCGADLYFTCPKCGTRNTADNVHCKKCGVNLASEIRKWKEAQAQLETKKSERKKNAGVLLVIILVLFILSGIITLAIKSASDRRESIRKTERYNATATAEMSQMMTVTAVNYPFKWTSKNGEYIVAVMPKFTRYLDGFKFNIVIYNNSEDRCRFKENLTAYALDDNNRRYEVRNRLHFDEVSISPGSQRKEAITINNKLSDKANTLTVFLDEFCGNKGVTVKVDLKSPVFAFVNY